MCDVRQMAAIAAINKMLKSGHFSICTVNDIAAMFDIVPDRDAMAILKPLHCVDYADMPRELYARLPAIIEKALSGSPVFQFQLKRGPEPLTLAIEPERRPGIVKRLLGVA